MIKLFRNVRQRLLAENRLSKYLIYAIGEIVLVVIGILIALQINNWNEERKSKLLEGNFIDLLTQDLKSDSINLQTLVGISDATVKSKSLILDYQNGMTSRPDSLSKHFLEAIFHGIPTFVPNKGAIGELQNAGGLSLIQEKQVSNQILQLYNAYDLFEENVQDNYVDNRNKMREIVFSRAGGLFIHGSSDVDEVVLSRLLLDRELQDRLINNWTVTYNKGLKEVLEENSEAIMKCSEYLNRLRNNK